MTGNSEVRFAIEAIPPGEAVFVAKAAHELRGAMGGIEILACTLADQSDEVGDPRLSALAHQLAIQSARVEMMAHQLLDLTRFGTGRNATRRQEVNLAELLDSIIELEGIDPDNDIVLDVADDLVVEVDPTALQQIVTNLVRNAYLHGGESVVLVAAIELGRLVLHVVDDGPGVPEHLRDRLFEPFVRSSFRNGNGLGLAIVAELAVALEGEVDYQPNEPSGSRFSVSLPLR